MDITAAVQQMTPWMEDTYTHLHQNPELSMQEHETAAYIYDRLNTFGCDEIHEIGGGVIGVLKNGDGPVVLYRAELDGLPVEEQTGFEYASTKTMANRDGAETAVMHACGHDFHLTAALAAASALADNRDAWSGTYLALFQPGEETAEGAQAMVDAGLVQQIPRPDVALAQHVLQKPVAGKVAIAAGPVMSTAASVRVTVHGEGSHGSMPHLGIDPIVIAASIVTRLQTLVSREVDPFKMAVVTVGSIQAGDTANVIPATATMLLNVRAYDEDVREQLLTGITRIVNAECTAANVAHAPEIEVFNPFPLTDNDAHATEQVRTALVAHFGDARVEHLDPVTASEDFSIVPDAFGAPYVYWALGGFTEGSRSYPNHNPRFGPVMQPTLTTGTQAALAAILAYLNK